MCGASREQFRQFARKIPAAVECAGTFPVQTAKGWGQFGQSLRFAVSKHYDCVVRPIFASSRASRFFAVCVTTAERVDVDWYSDVIRCCPSRR